MIYKLLIMGKPKNMGNMINDESCMVGENQEGVLHDW